MTRRVVVALLLFASLTVLAGCAAGTRGSAVPAGGTPESVSITASEAASQSALPTEPGAGGLATGGGSASGAVPDIKAIDAELNAMQKELDGLAMPDDSDFSSAEGALY